MTPDNVFWCLDSTCHSALLFILNMLIGCILVQYKLRLLACWTTKCTVKVSQFTGYSREGKLPNESNMVSLFNVKKPTPPLTS